MSRRPVRRMSDWLDSVDDEPELKPELCEMCRERPGTFGLGLCKLCFEEFNESEDGYDSLEKESEQ